MNDIKMTQLTALELNKYRFMGNHTPLTPDQIEQMRQVANSSNASGNTTISTMG